VSVNTERSVLIGIDLDGTIEDSRQDMTAAVQRVREQLKLEPRADAQVLPHLGGGMEALYQACFDDFLHSAEPTRLHQVRLTYEADYLAHVAEHTRLYDGVREALGALSRLGTLACITNKPEHISRELLRQLGVGELFSTVVGGDSGPYIKPHALMFEIAAERCDIDRSQAQALMIGDSDGDIRLAQNADTKSIWCAWGYVAEPKEQADARAQTPSELPEVAARLLGVGAHAHV